MENLNVVLQQLEQGCSCAAYDGVTMLRSQQRGVAPLLQWLNEGVCLEAFCVADKVVGRGAAFLYVLLHAKMLHARVISTPALELLKSMDIAVTYDICVPAIRNRDNTGFCPIEAAVLDCTDPQSALLKIKAKLKELQK